MVIEPKRLVLGVIGNDIHVVANRIIDFGLRKSGYSVCNLGINCQPSDFVDAALEHAAHAVLISSLNGEGASWCKNLRAEMINASLLNIILYVGGNLGIGNCDKDTIESQFIEFGFNRAYHRPESLDFLINDLKKDLACIQG